MREKTMKRGHLLLTLLAFVSLMWLGTIHANAATVKAKVDVKKFYGMAEQVLHEINKQRRSNGLSDLKMDANLPIFPNTYSNLDQIQTFLNEGVDGNMQNLFILYVIV